MRCPNCGNEIGYRDICPYCGKRIQYDFKGQIDYNKSGYEQANIHETIPGPSWQKSDNKRDKNRDRHIRNIDRCGIMTVILLAAIFVIELLQLMLQIG